MLRSFVARLRELFDRKRIARDLDDELALHIELEVEHHIKRGMTPDEARRTAALAFGGVQRFREETRDARGFERLESMFRDARFAVRRLRRAPIFSLGVIATLAIGIGAAGGIGALVYGVMFRPLPYADPDRLVRISIATPGMGIPTVESSAGTYVYFRERATSFTALAAYLENEGVTLTDRDAPERVVGAIVTPNTFSILGTRLLLGRAFTFEEGVDDTPAQAWPVILGYDLWRRRYGGDSSIVGQRVEVNRRRLQVVGVLPPGFAYPSARAAIYFPDNVQAARAGLSERYLTIVGRLKPGASVGSAQAELDGLISHFHERFPELSAADVQRSGLSARVQTLRDAIAAPVRGELVLLALMVAFVLLIATTNVLTLYLLRAESQRGEVSVSRALGAGSVALRQRFIIEGIIVSVIGGLAALPIVILAVATKLGFTPGVVPRLHDVEVTPQLIGALLGLSLVVGLVLGLIASARASGGNTAEVLRASMRASPSRAWQRTQESLVAFQIALALSLLLGAGLMAESLARLRRVDIGFKPQGGAVFSLVLPRNGYAYYPQTADFHLRLVDALQRAPGVTSAAYAMQFPSMPQQLSSHPKLARADGSSTKQVVVDANVVSPEYFQVMRIPIRAGRTFARGDVKTSEPAVVLGAALARDLFGDADPLGERVRVSGIVKLPTYRVVGVVGDVHSDRITEGVLRMAYFPLVDDYAVSDTTKLGGPFVPAGGYYVVRSELPFERLVPEIRRTVSALDARVPISGARTLDNLVAESTARVNLTMLLLTVAAIATLLLGAIGLYSVIAYAVAGRAGEFAIRLALGASPREIMALVFRRGVLVACVGILAGVGVAFGGARLIRGLLYEVSATDPVTYAAAVAVVLIAVVGATYVPARRAGDADPAGVLRGT